jgi:hypothetical protein
VLVASRPETAKCNDKTPTWVLDLHERADGVLTLILSKQLKQLLALS